MTKQQILRMQGAYYIATGLWPLVSMPSFEAVTGPKVDKWLVKMVGLLAATIGASLVIGSRKSEETDEAILFLGITAALSFAGIDTVYAARRRISPIYLADAFVEVVFLGLLSLK